MGNKIRARIAETSKKNKLPHLCKVIDIAN